MLHHLILDHEDLSPRSIPWPAEDAWEYVPERCRDELAVYTRSSHNIFP